MIKIGEFIDAKGTVIEAFVGHDGWLIKFGSRTHYINNSAGVAANTKAVKKHIFDYFSGVKEVTNE